MEDQNAWAMKPSGEKDCKSLSIWLRFGDFSSVFLTSFPLADPPPLGRGFFISGADFFLDLELFFSDALVS